LNQSEAAYDMTSAIETLEPWLEQHLPTLDVVARRHFLHLVTGIIEQQSLLVRAIAAASPFQAEPESNFVQVQRILQDSRLSLETVYYPLLMQLLTNLPAEHCTSPWTRPIKVNCSTWSWSAWHRMASACRRASSSIPSTVPGPRTPVNCFIAWIWLFQRAARSPCWLTAFTLATRS
jgi:hypothetical protein